MSNTIQQKNIETQFSSAYREYRRPLLARALYKVSDPVLSEELVQDTFMKVWVYLSKGGEVCAMKAFLYHVLNNLIVDQYRKHKTISLDTLLEKGYEPSQDSSEKMINSIDGKAVLPLIEQLPQKYQRVMDLRYIQDLSLEEMSSILNESKQTIAVQAHRGLEKIKVLYSNAFVQSEAVAA